MYQETGGDARQVASTVSRAIDAAEKNAVREGRGRRNGMLDCEGSELMCRTRLCFGAILGAFVHSTTARIQREEEKKREEGRCDKRCIRALLYTI